MTGKRKLIIALASLITYIVVVISKGSDPLQTGLGIAAIAGTIIYGYMKEYQNK